MVRYRALINNSLHEGSGDEKIYSPIEKSNSPWALPSRYMIFPGISPSPSCNNCIIFWFKHANWPMHSLYMHRFLAYIILYTVWFSPRVTLSCNTFVPLIVIIWRKTKDYLVYEAMHNHIVNYRALIIVTTITITYLYLIFMILSVMWWTWRHN